MSKTTVASTGIDLSDSFAFTGTVSGAGYDLVHTITASSDANVTFNSTYITSTYKHYIVQMIDLVPATDSQHLKFLASADNFSSDIGSYDRLISHDSSGNAGTPDQFNGSTNMDPLQITGTQACGSASGESFSGHLCIYNPSNSSVQKMMSVEAAYVDSDAVSRMAQGYCTIDSTSAVNAIRFFFASGNIASGVFKLYGVN